LAEKYCKAEHDWHQKEVLDYFSENITGFNKELVTVDAGVVGAMYNKPGDKAGLYVFRMANNCGFEICLLVRSEVMNRITVKDLVFYGKDSIYTAYEARDMAKLFNEANA